MHLHGSFPNIYSTWGPLSQHSSPASLALQLTSTLLIAQECGKRDGDQPLALYSSSYWYRVTIGSLMTALGDGGGMRCNRDKEKTKLSRWHEPQPMTDAISLLFSISYLRLWYRWYVLYFPLLQVVWRKERWKNLVLFTDHSKLQDNLCCRFLWLSKLYFRL